MINDINNTSNNFNVSERTPITANKLGAGDNQLTLMVRILVKLSQIIGAVSEIKEKISFKARRIERDTRIAKRIFHLAFKGYRSEQTSNIYHQEKIIPKNMTFRGKELAGMSSYEAAKSRYKEAESILEYARNNSDKFTSEERRKLAILVKQRKIVYDIEKKHSSKRRMALLNSALKALEKDTISDEDPVIEYNSKDGAKVRSFLFMGGWKDHAITFEAKRVEKEGLVKYYFIYSNKGAGVEDQDIHSRLLLINKNFYSYTRVTYEVDKQKLSTLIKSLAFTDNMDMEDVLGIIKSNLKPSQQVLGQLHLQKVQKQSTCTESCFTEQEKRLIGEKLSRKVKLYTIMAYAKAINKRIDEIRTFKSDKKINDNSYLDLNYETLYHALQSRINNLCHKLDNMREKYTAEIGDSLQNHSWTNATKKNAA